MKLTIEFSKAQLIDKISQDIKLDGFKKELLGFLLDIESIWRNQRQFKNR